MSISQNSIQAIKEAIQIADIIGEFVSLTKKGVNYIACCPFHNERTGSFIVNPSRNNFKCFGCGKSGDAIEFLKEHEGMTYPEALRYIGKKYGIIIQEDEKPVEISEAEKRRESIYEVLKWAQSHFAENLLKDKPATGYLEKRELSKAIKDFGIGYSRSGNDLLSSAASQGYSNDLLLYAGLIRKGEDGHLYDAFSKRIMFPFYDRTGRIIGFTGRLITQEKDKPKYLNSPETDVFKKSKFLYGLYQSKKSIIQENNCFLFEGQTDVISLHLAGIKNSVAGSGTALSDDQVRMIRSFTNTITFVYDLDPAGVKAAVKNIVIPLQQGMDVYIVSLPEGEDPDSMVRRIGGPEMKLFLEKNRKDIVTFRLEMAQEEIKSNPLHKAKVVKELVGQISLIPDESTRMVLLQEVSKILELNLDLLKEQVKKQLPKPEIHEKGFYGFDVAIDAIKEANLAIIVEGPADVVGRHAKGEENTISLPEGILQRGDITKLVGITRNVIIEGLTAVMDDDDCELPLAIVGRQLTEGGIHVEIKVIDKTDESEHMYDFLDYFVSKLSKHLQFHPDTKKSKKYVEMVAEFLSKLDNTIVHIKCNEIAKQFGLTNASFSKVLKPYIDKRKNLAAQAQEKVVIDEQHYVFDIAHLPDYVDQDFYQRFGFFPAENKTGHKIFYVFRTMENTLVKVGNFFLEPLFHVYDDDPAKNKRVMKFFHSELNKEEFVELKSSDMAELAQFRKFLWNHGGYLLTNGKQYHYDKILESIALQFPKCHEISTFGWQPEGFFAFSNGIIAGGQFTSVDELGLIKFKNETYYSPAFSRIYKDRRADNDKYEYDRFLVYKPEQETTWVEWSTLMYDVYKYNNNGTWAILFALLSAHRSLIFPIERIFTSLFFIGPTESGKSRIAESIRAPWMFGAPLFNLNSGTDAAFFTSMERFRDIPVIFEEYNDYQISDTKFQGLKAAVYDNEGKTKRKDASTKDLDQSKINCSPILLGQEGPERDDGALGNRVVQRHVPKRDEFSEEETNLYNNLKERESMGLSNIAMAITNRRDILAREFAKYFREWQKKVKQDIQAEGGSYQTRIINTVSLFIAMAKVWSEHCKNLPLPFSFEEFYEDAKKQISKQSEDISSSNRLSVFFDTINMLYAQGQIIDGREFAVSIEKRVTIQKTRAETEETDWKGEEKKVLFLVVNDVIQVYQRLHQNESLKLNTLRMYLKDHPAYIGQVKSHRFTYQFERWMEDPTGQGLAPHRVIEKADRNTSCIALDYAKIVEMGVDLERLKDKSVQLTLPLNGSDNNGSGHSEADKEGEKVVALEEDLPF